MAITSFLNPARQDFGAFPAERPPAGFGDVVTAAFKSFRDNTGSDAAERLTLDERRKNITQAEEILGREIRPEDAEGFKPLKLPELKPTIYDSSFDGLKQRSDEAVYNAEYVDKAVQALKDADPVRYASIKTKEEVREAARERANQSRTDYEKAMRASDSRFNKFVGSLIGGIGAAATDPINIAASVIPFGQARSVSLLGFIGREALINAGAEAAIQPFVLDWQKELGQEYGFTEAVENVAIAGLFGGTVGAVAKGSKPAASWMFNRMGNLKEVPAQFKDAAKYMSKVAHIPSPPDSQLPSPKPQKLPSASHRCDAATPQT